MSTVHRMSGCYRYSHCLQKGNGCGGDHMLGISHGWHTSYTSRDTPNKCCYGHHRNSHRGIGMSPDLLSYVSYGKSSIKNCWCMSDIGGCRPGTWPHHYRSNHPDMYTEATHSDGCRQYHKLGTPYCWYTSDRSVGTTDTALLLP